MKKQRPWWIRPIAGIIILTTILLIAPVYGRVTSGGKISPEIDRTAAQVDITVALPFEPENYHRDTLADLGVFAGRVFGDPTKMRLRAVTQENLDAIANLFWVEGIELS